MENKKFLAITILILLGIAAIIYLPRKQEEQPEPVIVSDFASCQMAGGEIIDGDPVTCKMPDGRTFDEEEHSEPEVVLDYPKYGDLVKSPLTIVGRARGTWFFEANLPITLKDDKGNILIQQGAQAQGDWMTTDYVPFSTTLNFDPKAAEFGVLIIEKDNPSGQPEFDSSFAIPVRFK